MYKHFVGTFYEPSHHNFTARSCGNVCYVGRYRRRLKKIIINEQLVCIEKLLFYARQAPIKPSQLIELLKVFMFFGFHKIDFCIKFIIHSWNEIHK